MSTVTYSEDFVCDTIVQRFVPLQIDVTADASNPLVQRFHQIWTPDLRLLSAEGYELDRWNGYLPPAEFTPRLLASQAQAYLRVWNEAAAAATYEEVLRRFPTSDVASEAQYFLAVATYKQTHLPDDLIENWKRLQSRYPTSIWRTRQSFTEVKPAARKAT